MPTRHCPAVYDGQCGPDRPCARFESEDETPWLSEMTTHPPTGDDEAMTGPQQVTIPGVAVNGGIAPGPDGKAWTAINIQHGLVVFGLVITPDVALQLAEQIPAILLEAAAAARRANLGLILPGQTGNGHGPIPGGT
jgi:hypothetical protein